MRIRSVLNNNFSWEDKEMEKGYLVKRLSEIEGVPCACGTSQRPITSRESNVANIHVTHITQAKKHYHKECTEFYYILEGTGTMELNDDTIDLEPGTVIMINTNTWHASKGNFKTLIVGVPPLKKEDEFFS